MESSHGKGNFEGRVRPRMRVMSLPWKATWRPSTTKRRIQFWFDTSEGGSDRELVLGRFQVFLSEVANTKHMARAAVGGRRQRWQKTNPKTILPKAGSKTTREHVQVWTGLQFTESRRDIRKVVERTGWRSWGIVKYERTNNIIPCAAGV